MTDSELPCGCIEDGTQVIFTCGEHAITREPVTAARTAERRRQLPELQRGMSEAAIRIDAKDVYEHFDILDIFKEDDTIVIATKQGVSILLYPVEEIAETITDLL